ncbi:MAG TPA: NHL repeat-containing protein [Verrucomicrobiae bacterium]|nr:NHL repeat-containing protein [Verrucomicrobiae bacterium]
MKLKTSLRDRISTAMLFTVAVGVGLALSAGQLRASANYEPYTFTHFAGSPGGPGSDDGTGSAARFNFPYGAAVDSSGNVYVADTYNETIRKITPAGAVTTLAGSAGSIGSADGTGNAARFWQPYGLAVDSSGNVYVADSGNDTIRKITPAGVVTTLAGLAGAQGSANGTSSAARFWQPYGVAVDSSGNVYVADQGNDTIRKITPAGVVTTLAGLAGAQGSADGTNSTARFTAPAGVAVDGSGNVYVADYGNNEIREITPAGVVTTLAGKAGTHGHTDATGGAARFYNPSGIGVDSSDNVYVGDSNNDTIRKVAPGGVVTTLAGLALNSGSADGTNNVARFNFPLGLGVESSGNIYVADYYNDTIRKITPAGAVTTLAGLAVLYGSADGTNSAARFDSPAGVAADSLSNVYVADTLNQTIRKITPAGVVTTLAGLPAVPGSADGTNSTARFYDPFDVAADSSGNVYVADNGNNTIRKITPAGVVTTLAGLAGASGSVDGANSVARFNGPSGVAVDSSGNVYVADSNNDTIRKVTPEGEVTTLAGLAGAFGNADGANSAARFNAPFGVAVDSTGNVYVGDSGNQTIRKITPAGVVTTLAGLAGNLGGDDGEGSAARFDFPRGVAVDSSNNVYVADYYNYTIRKITAAGVVTTLAGLAQAYGSDDGTGSAARFYFPQGVAVDSSGNVYVADTDTQSIRKGIPASLAVSLPLLSVTTANNQIVLAWPTNNADFTLQSASVLNPGTVWSDLTSNPPVLGSQFVVTNPISSGAQYFRLKK